MPELAHIDSWADSNLSLGWFKSFPGLAKIDLLACSDRSLGLLRSIPGLDQICLFAGSNRSLKICHGVVFRHSLVTCQPISSVFQTLYSLCLRGCVLQGYGSMLSGLAATWTPPRPRGKASFHTDLSPNHSRQAHACYAAPSASPNSHPHPHLHTHKPTLSLKLNLKLKSTLTSISPFSYW